MKRSNILAITVLIASRFFVIEALAQNEINSRNNYSYGYDIAQVQQQRRAPVYNHQQHSQMQSQQFFSDVSAEQEQDISGGRPLNEGWRFMVGAGALVSPAFLGSDEYQVATLPSIRVQYGEKFFASVEEGIRYNIIDNNGFIAGPIGRYMFPREEENGGNPFVISGGDITGLQGLGDVDGTFELGGFLQYGKREFNVRAELRQGLGGHEGMVADLSANLNLPLIMDFKNGRPLILSFGPRATIVDDNYNQAYFGINSVQSANSGLNQYNAKAGLLSYGLGATTIIPVSDRVTSTLFMNYTRLAGDAADSPIVQERGSENQFVAGLFFSYQF